MEEEFEYRGRRIFATPSKTGEGKWQARARVEYHRESDVIIKVIRDPDPGRTFDHEAEASRQSTLIAQRWIDQNGI